MGKILNIFVMLMAASSLLAQNNINNGRNLDTVLKQPIHFKAQFLNNKPNGYVGFKAINNAKAIKPGAAISLAASYSALTFIAPTLNSRAGQAFFNKYGYYSLSPAADLYK